MNNRSKSWKLSSLIVTFPWLFATAGLQGMNLYTYDLDSLVYMSPEIVEGKLGNEHSTNNVPVQSLKISAAHRGRLQVGQSIDVTALDFYSVSHKGFWGGDKLKDGDQVFLFLDRVKNTFLYPQRANTWMSYAAVGRLAGKPSGGSPGLRGLPLCWLIHFGPSDWPELTVRQLPSPCATK